MIHKGIEEGRGSEDKGKGDEETEVRKKKG